MFVVKVCPPVEVLSVHPLTVTAEQDNPSLVTPAIKEGLKTPVDPGISHKEG